MPSYLLWQALVTMAPTIIHNNKERRRRLQPNYPVVDRMRFKREDAPLVLPVPSEA